MSTTILENDNSTTTAATTATLNLTVGNIGGGGNIGGTVTNGIVSTTARQAGAGPSTSEIGPISKKPKIRPTPYAKPILIKEDRRHRGKKKITWQPEESLMKIHYFELIPDERTNVNRLQPETAANASSQSMAASSPNAHANRINTSRVGGLAQANIDGRRPSMGGEPVVYAEWRLIQIDFTPGLPSPGWNSVERAAQAERETCVLGAIDLPGQPSTIDEPDSTSAGDSASKDDVKIIPLDNPEGMYTEYPDIYNSEIVNGIRAPPGSYQPVGQPGVAAFNGQPSQLLPDQFHQQLVNVVQNPFTFQEMSAQFQQQPQQHQQFPFASSAAQQQPQPFQTQFVGQPQVMQPQQTNSFINQQQAQQPQQQPGQSPRPITPWLNYPFNQVSENSHGHLFRRPAT